MMQPGLNCTTPSPSRTAYRRASPLHHNKRAGAAAIKDISSKQPRRAENYLLCSMKGSMEYKQRSTTRRRASLLFLYSPSAFSVVIIMLMASSCVLCCARPARSSFVLLMIPSSPRIRDYHTSLATYKKRKYDDGSHQELTWETFEFSQLPKFDKRFASEDTTNGDVLAAKNGATNNSPSLSLLVSKDERLRQLEQRERCQDERWRREQQRQWQAWRQLDPAQVRQATAAVRPLVNADRVDRIAAVLARRTAQTRFLFENPSNPSNVWACLRTIESFGVQHVDVVLQSDRYRGQAALHQKRGMRTAVGAAQWLTLRNHATTAAAIDTLRAQQPDLRILASDLNPSAKDVRTIDWDERVSGDDDDDDNNRNGRPICIVMGNEERGISDEMRALVDETFTLPMVGFAESFNLSVATAIALAHLSAASQTAGRGPLRPGDLPEHERNCLMLKGLLNSLPQRRMADAVLKRAGIELPKELMDLL